MELDTLRQFFAENKSMIELSMLFSAFKYRFSRLSKLTTKEAKFIELAKNAGYAAGRGKHDRKGKFFKYFDNIREIATSIKSEDLLSSMTLAYLISIQEAFIINFVKEFYLAYKQINGSRKEFKYRGKGINGIEEYFKDKLAVSFESEFSSFAVIKEAFCRRHIVIHNKSVTDEFYCKQTGYQKLGEKLEPNFKYMENIFGAMNKWNEFMLLKLVEALNLNIEISKIGPRLLKVKDIFLKTL
jgi:hypothetical protein